jgi:hypothetical protein
MSTFVDTEVVELVVTDSLFHKLDPVGLLRRESAERYLRELRGRLAEAFPNAKLHLEYRDDAVEATSIRLTPRDADAESTVRRIADGLTEQLTWFRYDEMIRTTRS